MMRESEARVTAHALAGSESVDAPPASSGSNL
jgi:hypothetical protein